MTSKIKFEKISLIENRIVLSFKSKEEVIHFSEIDKVYIKINKMKSLNNLYSSWNCSFSNEGASYGKGETRGVLQDSENKHGQA